MLQLFNVNWADLTAKMPEIAEAGYTSLWLPPPAKAGSVWSVGYDLFDPFDLGDKNQRGTVRTKYGTKTELVELVETAHRFGIRVYFDNIVNHRGFDVPGYNASTPTNLYPGLRPQDFHLRTVSGGYFVNWPGISDWNQVNELQRQSLSGLIDLANEPGGVNLNFGNTIGSSTPKVSFVRHPGSNSYYMDTNLPAIAGPWHPFNGVGGDPVSEDVNAYLIRSVLWLLAETKCDGFRLDAVKHVPSGFFGDAADTPFGYTGGIQAMFDQVHGYGNNLPGHGYAETGGNRDSLFDTETVRNDAMVFGEHLGEPPGFQEYLERGMRLLNAPYHFRLNNILGNPSATLTGLDQRDYRPNPGAFTGPQSVLFAQSHDDGLATARELQNGYNFTREGLPVVYSDGYNHAPANPGEEPFPRHAHAPYLGQFGDNKMPDLAWLHHQVARGGTRSRWSDNDVVAYERYDYRGLTNAFDNPDATVLLFAMNDNFASDISFDDGVAQASVGTYYECFPVGNSRGQGLVVGFAPGSVLWQLADAPHKGSACSKLLVRLATQNLAEAQATANDPNPVNRKVYVGGQSLAPGGGAIELKIPSGGYVLYSYQGPEPSRTAYQAAIEVRQGSGEVPRIFVRRVDGVDGDAGFNPLYPFKMRGSVDAAGNLIGGTNVGNRTYEIDIPVVTNGAFDILVRCDASASNVLMKLDGGVDLNSQLGLGPTGGLDRRDHRPGYTNDMFLGYEGSLSDWRRGPEKFAARLVARNNVTSLGAETYLYTVGGSVTTVNGSGNGAAITTATATWVYHDAAAPNTVAAGSTPTQRMPLNPAAGQAVEVWVKAGYQFQINRCFLYYTTDGSNPEGAFGMGFGTTKSVKMSFAGDDASDGTIDWWKGTIPGTEHANGVQVRYKVALFRDGIEPISDSDGAKTYGLHQASITNFNPATATVWLHNNLNTNHTTTGLAEGYHILRARAFLPRAGKAPIFNTFAQTFYYDAQPPTGAVAFPPANGTTLYSSSYTVVVRADNSVRAVEFNIADSNPFNDDAATGQANGNGLTNGVARFVAASEVTPDAGLSAQYPNLKREFRFVYAAIPSSGTATLTMRLREATSAVLSNRITTLTRTLITLAPAAELFVSSPEADGAILTLAATTPYTIRACFTPALATNEVNLFSIIVNGVLQPRSNYSILAPSPGACSATYRTLVYDWVGAAPGTNVIEVTYTNQVSLGDRRTVAVARPGDSDGDGMGDAAEVVAGTDPFDAVSVLRITELADGNRLVVWNSASNRNYRVLATTNLAFPMAPISPIIPGSGNSAFYYDGAPDAPAKFYRVEVVP